MFFRKKTIKKQSHDEQKEIRYGEYTEGEIADILCEYGRHIYEEFLSAKNPAVGLAQERIARAEAIVGTSGVGAALAPVLVEHIMHWHAWILRDDFGKYVRFPASDIHALQIERDDGQRFAERVSFTYGASHYRVEIVQEAKPWWDDDKLLQRGRVSVFVGEVELVTLDMSLNLDKEHARWRWDAVSAFLPGLWMKDFIEIGAHIEAYRVNATQALVDDDVLKRASRIDGI